MTPEEAKHILAYWKDRPDVPFDVVQEFAEALDERDALLRECLELIDGEWSGHEIQARISKVLGESDASDR